MIQLTVKRLQLQEMLENYSPWGKPGGGAPCESTLRKKNFPLEPSKKEKNGHKQWVNFY